MIVFRDKLFRDELKLQLGFKPNVTDVFWGRNQGTQILKIHIKMRANHYDLSVSFMHVLHESPASVEEWMDDITARVGQVSQKQVPSLSTHMPFVF